MENGCEHCARRVENKRCDEDRADHDAEEPERGQTRQPRDQQADHARDFEGGDQVSEPLTHADRGEHLHLGLLRIIFPQSGGASRTAAPSAQGDLPWAECV